MTAVVVIEDHPLYRDALVQLLTGRAGISVIGAVPSVEAVLRLLPDHPPGDPVVIVLDLGLPGLSGTMAVRFLSSRGCRVLVVTAHAGRDEALSVVAAGARGYLTKRADGDEIVRAVQLVAAGHSYVPPALATAPPDAARRADAAGGALVLSERERQVLALVAAGERDQDIAVELGISVRTVRSHLDRIREKTGQRRRPDLTRFALERGIVHVGGAHRARRPDYRAGSAHHPSVDVRRSFGT